MKQLRQLHITSACLWLVLLAGCCCFSGAANAAEELSQHNDSVQLMHVDDAISGESLQIRLHCDRPPTFTSFLLTGPARLIVDLPGVERKCEDCRGEQQIEGLRVKLRYSSRKQIFRVVIKLPPDADYNIRHEANSLILILLPPAGKTIADLLGTAPAVATNQKESPQPVKQLAMADSSAPPPQATPPKAPESKPQPAPQAVEKTTPQPTPTVAKPAPEPEPVPTPQPPKPEPKPEVQPKKPAKIPAVPRLKVQESPKADTQPVKPATSIPKPKPEPQPAPQTKPKPAPSPQPTPAPAVVKPQKTEAPAPQPVVKKPEPKPEPAVTPKPEPAPPVVKKETPPAPAKPTATVPTLPVNKVTIAPKKPEPKPQAPKPATPPLKTVKVKVPHKTKQAQDKVAKSPNAGNRPVEPLYDYATNRAPAKLHYLIQKIVSESLTRFAAISEKPVLYKISLVEHDVVRLRLYNIRIVRKIHTIPMPGKGIHIRRIVPAYHMGEYTLTLDIQLKQPCRIKVKRAKEGKAIIVDFETPEDITFDEE